MSLKAVSKIARTILFSVCAGLFAGTVLSCNFDFYGDLAGDLKKNTSTDFIFYNEHPDSALNLKQITESYEIGRVVTDAQLPYQKATAIIKPGYHVTSWLYYDNPQTGSRLIPDNITIDPLDGHVQKIKVNTTPASFYPSDIEPNTDTPYRVFIALETINNSGLHTGQFVRDGSKTVNYYGTTDTTVSASVVVTPVISGFERVELPAGYSSAGENVSEINIDGTGSAYFEARYKRKDIALNIEGYYVTSGLSDGGHYDCGGLYGETVPARVKTGYVIDHWTDDAGNVIPAFTTFPAESGSYRIYWVRASAPGGIGGIDLPPSGTDGGFALTYEKSGSTYTVTASPAVYNNYDFYLDGAIAATGSSNSVDIPITEAGAHSVLCVAADAYGNTVSATITITVN